MADNKRWFKVWNSILTDPSFDVLPNLCAGVWVKLGALVSKQGCNGNITVTKKQFFKWLNVSEKYLPYLQKNLSTINVILDTSCNGNISVTFSNWRKYQEFTDSYMRVKKFRDKHNDNDNITVTKEEKRREKKRSIIQNSLDDFIPKLKENPAYKGIDIDKELARMDAWFLTPKGKGRKKTKRFIVNWLNRIDVALPIQEGTDWRG